MLHIVESIGKNGKEPLFFYVPISLAGSRIRVMKYYSATPLPLQK